jgi:HK97 family phage prohead protease
MYAENPRPLDYFSPAEGVDPAEDDEVKDILRKWQKARQERSTAYVPAALKYNSVDVPTPADLQLVELQKQATLDIANTLGLDPEELGVSTTSRTYRNDVDRRKDRVNDVFSPYMRAITDRLSMGDVTRRGYCVDFVLDDYLKADPGTRATVQKTYHDMGALTVDEIRTEEKLPPLTAAQKKELAPPPAPAVAPPADAQPAVDTQPATTSVQNKRHLSVALTQPGHTFAETSTVGFSVDVEKRTVEGIVLPYGNDKVAQTFWRKYRFQPGSLQHSQDSRVKLLRDHDYSQPLGRLVHSEDRPEGRFARFKVASGEPGDRALALASEGVLDGFSVGVDFEDDDTVPDPQNKGVTLVRRADWRETSLTPMPAFDDARVTKVAASREGNTMPCSICGQVHAAGVACPTAQTTTVAASANQTGDPGAQTSTTTTAAPAAQTTTAPAPAQSVQAAAPAPMMFSLDQLPALLAAFGSQGAQNHQATAAFAQEPVQQAAGTVQAQADGGRQVVDPTRGRTVTASVGHEAAPYRFDRKGNLTTGTAEFSADVFAMAKAAKGNFVEGVADAKTRVEQFMRANFDTATTDVNELNPTVNRPEMYVDQKSFTYPIWSAIDKGSLDSVTPFMFPKFNTASGLVGDHTEGSEPSAGSFTTTNDTVTPTPISGKVVVNREVIDQGGNPQVSGLIWRQMIKGWNEALEAYAVTKLNAATLTSQTITITAGIPGTNSAMSSELESKLAALNFVRGGFTMRDFFLQADLYLALVGLLDGNGRKIYPILNPQNANGTAAEAFGLLNLAGIIGRPAWALAASGQSAATPSYLIDRNDVSGWASAPQRLEFQYQVKSVEIGIWGYKAFVINDVTGVRKISWDPVA